MLSHEHYVPLEGAIASLRNDYPEALKAIAKDINSIAPHKRFSDKTITGSEYGRRAIAGFAITHAQLGAYLDLAVKKYASVLIETEIGVVESGHVWVSREWLFNQRDQASRQPEVMREVALRSYASTSGTTVTPIQPLLEDQTPEDSRAEIQKLNIRLDRSLIIKADDERDVEIERLRSLLDFSDAERKSAIDERSALTSMVKTLTLENDQLRKARANVAQSTPLHQPSTPKTKRKPTNVEILNEETRATRKAVAECARLMWSHGDYAEHRTMDMVRTIRRLSETEPMGRLPSTDEVLARWLSKDAAPPFAKRKGRPRKEKSNK